MRKLTLFVLFTLAVFAGKTQDFSNKGKDFWLCFPSHVPSGGALASMALFITSDKNSSGTISVNGFNTTFTVTANQVTGPIDIPYATAHITAAQSGTVINKGIRVKTNPGQPAVVVYAHIYAGFRSAASLILPVATLGKKYYSTNFWQASTGGSKSQFQIIAVDTNTTVQYTLRRNGVLNPTPSTILLPNPGDMLQIQDDQDLTGSVIESISVNGAGCKKIAVFSGSSAIAIGRNGCSGGSYDPLYQQCYPVTAWGKNFGVMPFVSNPNGFHLRVTASENNTTVDVGGTIVTLNAGEYFPATNANPIPYGGAMTVTADKPVSVAQYLMSSNCTGTPVASLGDPDMVILNPIEQNINDISIFSSDLQAIDPNQKYIAVYMKTAGKDSFRINGAFPTSPWLAMFPNNGYSYLVQNLNSGATSFRLKADSGFNAIAYGLGNFESYAYSAGTNVRDLYQFISLQNQYATVNFPAACKGSPFIFRITFPYIPTKIEWDFNGLFPSVTDNSPVPDSSWVLNGRTVYRFKLPAPYTINTVGTYPIKVTAQNPTPDGCNGEQEIDYELQVFDPPVADFNFTLTGCVADTVRFFENSTNTGGRPVTRWHWNFGDNSIDSIKNPKHLYATGQSYNVKLAIITDVGCLSDTVMKPVALSARPVAKFGVSNPRCVGKNIVFTDSSQIAAGALTKWHWEFGDGTIIDALNGNPQTHAYGATGTYKVRFWVEGGAGCRSFTDSMMITINANPRGDFNSADACLPVGLTQFTGAGTISDGTQALLTYNWNFGDPNATPGNPNTATGATPTHNYSATGPYTVMLTTTSNNGCTHDTSKLINNIYARPDADFNSNNEVCLSDSLQLTDLSSGLGSNITNWFWDFGDGTTSTLQNPKKKWSSAGPFTVTLYIKTDKGCISDTATKSITVNQLPTANFTSSLTRCEGVGINFTDASVPNSGVINNWKWDFGDGTIVNAGTNATQTHAYSPAGPYTITLEVTTDKGCKSSLFSLPITVNPGPRPDFSAGNACLPSGITQFTDLSTISNGTQASFTFAWDFGDPNANAGNPNTSTIKNPTHQYSAVGPYSVKLTVTSINGCVKDTTKQINNIFPRPTAAITGNAEVCLSDSLQLNDASVGAGGVVNQWFWDFGDGTTSTLQNPKKKWNSAGPFTVKLYIITDKGCTSDTATKPIIVNQLPTANFSASLIKCEKSAITFTDASVPNSGILNSWKWDFGDGTIVNATTNAAQNHTYGAAGPYTVKLEVTSDKGCKSSVFNLPVTVNPKPVVDFTMPTVCLPVGAAQFNSLATISDGSQAGFVYAWTFGDGGVSAVQNPLHNYGSTGPFSVKLEVTSNNGCKGDTTKQLTTVYPEPRAYFKTTPEVCIGATFTFTDSSYTINGVTITEWGWDFGDGATSTLQNPTHTYAAAGTYIVKLRVKTNVGCFSNIFQRPVTVNPLPTGNFNFSSPTCDTRAVTFTDISTPNAGNLVKWEWDLGDATTPVLNNNTPFAHTYAAPGTYNVKLIVETDKGCRSVVVDKNVTINVLPVVNFGVPEICLDDPFAQFTDSSSISDGTGAQLTYLWNFGDPNANIANPNTSTAKNPVHKYSQTGNYTVTLTTTSVNGCAVTLSKPFTVNGSFPRADFSVTNPATLCSNLDVEIKDLSTVDFGNVTRVEIYWDWLNNPTIKTTDDFPNPGVKTYTHRYPAFGSPATRNVTIKMVAYSGGICQRDTNKVITLLASPSVQFNSIPDICVDAGIRNITQAGEIFGLTGAGAYSGPGISAGGQFNPAAAGVGTHVIRYTYIAANGCTDFKEQTITVNPVPTVNAGPDKTVLEGGTVQLSGSGTGNGLVYLWTPNIGITNPGTLTPNVSPAADITYTLTITSDKGCKASDQVFVKVLKAPEIPNVFTPNNDGVNDRWEIQSLSTYPGCTVEVFNRYGQAVYFNVGYATPWDGNYKGKPLPVGTYYYIINPKNGRQPVNGWVTIVR